MRLKLVLLVLFLYLMMSGCAFASSLLNGWNYATPVIIGDSQLNNYQVKINLQGTDPADPGYIDFSKIRSDGADIRVTDSDGITQLPYWIESWDYNKKTATIWSKVSSASSSVPPYFKFSTTSSAHNTYGLSYPVTYEFNIPSGSANLKAYKKYNVGDGWTQISEKTSNDFFNGIEAIRFDYPNNKAYVSVAFDANSNDIYLEIVDGNNNQVGTYNHIDKFYDNRKATVVASADDWLNRYDSDFSTACDMFRSKQIWFTPGIITNDDLDDPVSSSTWADIQSKINAGYMEPASHSKSHIYPTDSDYPGTLVDIDGSKQDILSNLNMISLDKKGSSQYLYTFIEPGGYSTSAMRTQLGLSKYLVDRSIIHPAYYDFTSNQVNPAIPTGLDFPTWDSTNGLYSRFGYSIRMGNGTSEGPDPEGIANVNVLNSAFDIAYNQHRIYHLMCHPWAVDWTPGQYADQHTTYISGKKDVWYVGLGDMFVYNYVRDQKASQYIPVSGKMIYVYYGNSSAQSLSNYSSVFIKDYNDSGYTGLWHMDEGAGTTTADSSGNGNTGTITGATWGANDGGQWGSRSDVAFQNGSYLQFNGVNSYVSFGNANSLNSGNGPFSIEMWVNASTQSMRYPCIIDKSDSSDWTGPGTHQGYVLMNRDINGEGATADDYRFIMGDGTDSSHIPDSVPVGPLQNTGWNHIVITVDAGTAAYPQIKVYKNGAFLTSINRVNVGSVDTTNNLIVGKWRSYGRYFEGSVDELREYNRVLSSDEVLAHYQRKSVTVSEADVNVLNGSAQTATDTNLSALSLSNGTLSPTFDKNTTNYTASVANSVSSVTVTPTTEDNNATVTVNGTAVLSGHASNPINLIVGTNNIQVIATAQNGANKTYNITVNRAAPISTNANLSALSLSNGSLSPVFASGTLTYTASVANSVSSVTVTPTTEDNNATVTVNGTAVLSGHASNPINLIVGTNNIQVVVTAQNGANKTYAITVSRAAPLSTNANLSALSLSNGSLSPVFASGTLTYTASVANSVSSVTVTPTTEDSTANITVNGAKVNNATASGPINLNVGTNLIYVNVTAQDGATKKNYTITVTRLSAASSSSNLSGLTISSGVLNPSFASGTTTYTDSLSYSVSSITVTPTAADSTAKITVNGYAVASGASQPIGLNVGKNTIRIVVTAQSGATKTYTITVTRKSASNKLAALTISNGTLTPQFASGTLSYTARVTKSVSRVTVTPKAEDSNAKITVNGYSVTSGSLSQPISLRVGKNTIRIVVTPQSGATKTYTITVTKLQR